MLEINICRLSAVFAIIAKLPVAVRLPSTFIKRRGGGGGFSNSFHPPPPPPPPPPQSPVSLSRCRHHQPLPPLQRASTRALSHRRRHQRTGTAASLPFQHSAREPWSFPSLPQNLVSLPGSVPLLSHCRACLGSVPFPL